MIDSKDAQIAAQESAANLNCGDTAAYRYDGSGLRVEKKQSGQTTSYVWDTTASPPVVVQDTTRSGTGTLLGANSYVYGLDLLSATDNNNVTTYFLQDGLGSTTGLTNSSGTMTDSYTYDAFGATKTHTGTSTSVWQFAGEQNDTTVNQSPYYLRARYYDPVTGRFLTRDPWPANTLDAQSLNEYAYVYDDPVRYTDVYGYGINIPNPADAIKDVTHTVSNAAGAVAGGVVQAAGDIVGAAAAGVDAVVQGAGEVVEEMTDGVQAVGGAIADTCSNLAGAAGSWLSTCNWGKVAAGAAVIAGGAFVGGTGLFALGVVGAGAEATTALGVYEGLEMPTMLGITTVTGGGIMGLGGYAMSKAGCGQGPHDIKE